MGKVGTSADSSIAESFNASPKRETLRGGANGSHDVRAARRAVFAWITRYNTRRRVWTCGYLSSTYEDTHAPAPLQPAA